MTGPTRRTFLSSMAAATALAPIARAAGTPARSVAPRKILVLGGTGFLGPHFVRGAIAHGHTVTLFNRGKSNAGLFPELERLRGDREKGDLESLKGREFDAVVDTSGYVPAHVEATAKLFAATAKHYQFISSISVYGQFGERPDVVDETAAVGTVEDEKVALVETIRQSMEFYGPLKARCEAAAEAAMPGKVSTLRPGLIVGPGDSTDRFTWWPVRIDRGGEVMAPGDPDGQVQFIDVRDLADFMLRCIENDIVGVKNVNGFAGPVSMGDLLSACKCATSKPVTLTWVSEAFMTANAVRPWEQMPLFLPRKNRSIVDVKRAIDAGITFRPVGDTVRDTLQWAKTERGDRPFGRVGVPAAREKELLEKWRAEAKSGADEPAVR